MHTKWTPGPWDLLSDYNGWHSIGENHNGLPVVRIDEDNVFPLPEREANAKLIAAAPDMFRALPNLKPIIAWLQAGCSIGPALVELDKYQERIDAARLLALRGRE